MVVMSIDYTTTTVVYELLANSPAFCSDAVCGMLSGAAVLNLFIESEPMPRQFSSSLFLEIKINQRNIFFTLNDFT